MMLLLGYGLLLWLSWAGVNASMAQQQPGAIAPYRYTFPPNGTLDSLEQQKAFSYRNQLGAEKRRLYLQPAPRAGAALRLRSQGELNREIDRIDRILQR